MFQYWPRLNTRNEMGTKKKRLGPTTLSLKASRRTINVTRKQTCMRYIIATLSKAVAVPSNNMAIRGKNTLCSKCWRQRSETLNVPDDSLSKKGTIVQVSPKGTSTPNDRT